MGTYQIAILVFMLVCGIGAVFLILQRFQITTSRDQTLAGMGFTPVGQPDEGFQQKMYRLYTNRRWHTFFLDSVFRKPFPEGEYCFFNLYETTGRSHTRLVNMGLAVISPRLNLPCFAMYPRPAGTGVAAGLANKFQDTLFAALGNQVSFEFHPAFQKQYMVISDDPGGVRRFFSPEILNRLTQVPAFYIVAGGDTFTVERAEYHNKRVVTLEPEDVRQIQSDAKGLFMLFTAY